MSSKFLNELTIFHEEQAIAQRCFFGYLAIRDKASEDKELLGFIKSNPWFWSTVDYSLLLGALLGLGRIFGSGRHNIGKLLSVVEESHEEFSLQALERRWSKKLTSAELAWALEAGSRT
jgi:hypothetical protein